MSVKECTEALKKDMIGHQPTISHYADMVTHTEHYIEVTESLSLRIHSITAAEFITAIKSALLYIDTLEKIAKEVLHLDTMATRNSDGLDFHEVPVWGIQKALAAAYEAGRNSCE